MTALWCSKCSPCPRLLSCFHDSSLERRYTLRCFGREATVASKFWFQLPRQQKLPNCVPETFYFFPSPPTVQAGLIISWLNHVSHQQPKSAPSLRAPAPFVTFTSRLEEDADIWIWSAALIPQEKKQSGRAFVAIFVVFEYLRCPISCTHVAPVRSGCAGKQM